ncbi:Hcp family type VI secretion system effector [Photorhabdus tasmaniensis]
MSNLIYLTVKGQNQGLISAGCGRRDSIGIKAQNGHEDQIFVYSLQHLMTRKQNVSHHPVIITKPIDKASPLLAKSLDDNERLECFLESYRTSENGGLELYYTIRLGQAYIVSLKSDHPHSLTSNHMMPQEILSMVYTNITWNNVACSTGAYSIWDERIF